MIVWWVGFVLALVGLGIVGCRRLYGFLAQHQPVGGPILVVEGWLPDVALEVALQYFRAGEYKQLLVTGGPLGQGSLLVAYGTHAAVGAATFKAMGLEADKIVELPSPRSATDRTYLSALAVRQWLADNAAEHRRIEVCSLGPHARRTRLAFARVLPSQVAVGIVNVPSTGFDTRYWWRSSSGFRSVVYEGIAFFYARFLARWEKGTALDAKHKEVYSALSQAGRGRDKA